MIARDRALADLEQALQTNPIALLQGLPRVGRSTLISRLQEERPDARLVEVGQPARVDVGLQLYDDLDASGIPEFVRRFREVDRADRSKRFVVAPKNLQAMRHLLDELPGAIQIVHLDPLEPDEAAAEYLNLDVPAGPQLGLTPEATVVEQPPYEPNTRWLRGGLPLSLNAVSDAVSLKWRRNTISALLARDYSRFDLRLSNHLDLILTWLAYEGSEELDLDDAPAGDTSEVDATIDVLTQLGLIRELRNVTDGPVASRSSKSKFFVRDSGVLNALFEIETVDQLLVHPRLSVCWKSFAIESLIAATRGQATAWYYREAGRDGVAQIDLVLDFSKSGGPKLAIEAREDPAMEPSKAYLDGAQALGVNDGFLVHPQSRPRLDDKIKRLDLASACQRVERLATRAGGTA